MSGARAEMECHCGHRLRDHARPFGAAPGRCEMYTDGLDDPFVPGAKWTMCPCRAFDDSVLPVPGERLTFGVHRQPTPDAETAEAWPSLPSWSARLRARTTRALRGSR